MDVTLGGWSETFLTYNGGHDYKTEVSQPASKDDDTATPRKERLEDEVLLLSAVAGVMWQEMV